MGDYTQSQPKCLVALNEDETILSRQLNLLVKYELTEIVITTGPFVEQIKTAVTTEFPSLSMEYVHNPDYTSTNYIYSMFLIPYESISSDILLLHGDIVFDSNLLSNFLSSDHPNLVVVEETRTLPEKDFKGRIKNGLVTEIGVNVFGDDCYPLQPLYKFTQESFFHWYKEINAFVQDGVTSVYAEDAFNQISGKIPLIPYFKTQSQICMEIDNLIDLQKARLLIKERK